jgi:hypothetical protein
VRQVFHFGFNGMDASWELHYAKKRIRGKMFCSIQAIIESFPRNNIFQEVEILRHANLICKKIISMP